MSAKQRAPARPGPSRTLCTASAGRQVRAMPGAGYRQAALCIMGAVSSAPRR